jgi:predicted permease
MPGTVDVIQTGVSMLIPILVGFVCCRYKFLPIEAVPPLNRLLLDLCFFPLIARASASRDLSEVSFLPFAIGTCASLSFYALLALLFLFPFKDRFYMYLSSALPSAYINYLIIGLPIFNSIWPETENVMVAVLALSNDLVTLPSYLVLSSIYIIRRSNREHELAGDGLQEKFSVKILWRIVLRLITNPIVVGNATGFIWASTKWPVFPFLANLLKYMGDAVLGLSLFCVGGFLSQHSLVACGWLHFIGCMLLRHVAVPMLMALFSYVFHASGKLARQCILMACCPSATASYLLSDQAQTGPGVSSTMIFWTTVFVVPCQIAWIWALDALQLFPE